MTDYLLLFKGKKKINLNIILIHYAFTMFLETFMSLGVSVNLNGAANNSSNFPIPL